MQYFISNDISEIPIIQQHFIKLSAQFSIEMKWIHKLNVVIDEILSNIIKYAYEELNNHKIEIRIDSISKTNARIVFIDSGKAFNPLTFTPLNPIKNAEDQKEGGVGIHLVINLVKRINYERINNKNHLIIEMDFF